MGTSKRVLAFDIGASGGRAVVGKIVDGKIVMEEVHRFSNDPVMVGNTLYWDTLRQFYEIKQGIIKANLKGGFDSIGIDTWGVDFGLLDEHGELLENAVHYRDERTIGIQDEVFKVMEKDELYRITGNQFMDFNTIFQLYSLKQKRPWVVERAKTLLFTPDLFNYFLSGVKAAEYTMASTSQLLDANEKTWYKEMLQSLGIDAQLLQEIVPAGTVVGLLTQDICEELEMDPAQVIAVASHDTQSAVAAVPSQEEDFLFISCGTWSLFGTELNQPLINETSRRLDITNEGGFGGKITFFKNIIGLWLVQESRRQWIREGKELSFSTLEQLALMAEPFRSFIDPDAPEFNPAGNIPKRIRAFCRRTGQAVPQSEGEIVCCINQSLALKYRHILEQIEACTGKYYPVIHMIGGGIQSELLCQMTASASGRRVIAGPVEATALGNIAVQLITLGEIKDIKEARTIVANSEPTKEYLPQEQDRWEKAYYLFKSTLERSGACR